MNGVLPKTMLLRTVTAAMTMGVCWGLVADSCHAEGTGASRLGSGLFGRHDVRPHFMENRAGVQRWSRLGQMTSRWRGWTSGSA